jgi:group I intron endonuclease
MLKVAKPKSGFVTGVYCFRNKINGKVYVGSSGRDEGVPYRVDENLADLRKNEHHNIYLQRSWNKYGEENFTVEVLEFCSSETSLEREQYWLDFYDACNPAKGYNLCPVAGSRLGAKCTPEAIENMRKSPEERAAMAERARKQFASEEARAEMSRRATAMWQDPEYRTIITEKMRENARKRAAANPKPPKQERPKKAKKREPKPGQFTADGVRIQTVEHRKKNSDFQIARYQSEEERERTRKATSEAIMNDPVKRANRSRAAKISNERFRENREKERQEMLKNLSEWVQLQMQDAE